MRKYLQFLKFHLFSFIAVNGIAYRCTWVQYAQVIDWFAEIFPLKINWFDTVPLCEYYVGEFLTHSSQHSRYVPGHVTSWSPNIPGGRHVTWTDSWKNLEKWRHRSSKVSKVVLFLSYCSFLIWIIVYVTRNAELFYWR